MREEDISSAQNLFCTQPRGISSDFRTMREAGHAQVGLRTTAKATHRNLLNEYEWTGLTCDQVPGADGNMPFIIINNTLKNLVISGPFVEET